MNEKDTFMLYKFKNLQLILFKCYISQISCIPSLRSVLRCGAARHLSIIREHRKASTVLGRRRKVGPTAHCSTG